MVHLNLGINNKMTFKESKDFLFFSVHSHYYIPSRTKFVLDAAEIEKRARETNKTDGDLGE